MLKICAKCSELKKHYAKGYCKNCYNLAKGYDKIRWRKNANKPEFKLKNRKRGKEYYQKNKEKIIKRKYNYRKKYEKTPEVKRKKRVRNITRRKYGKAVICSKCGSKYNVQHHHPDKNNPDIFIDLCKSCHIEIEYPLESRNGLEDDNL